MTLKSNFVLMAGYNQGMNESMYSAAAKLSAADLIDDRGAFFGSVMGTFNHILVGDTIWLKRFSNHRSALPSLNYVREINSPKSLDFILHSDFNELRQARKRMDRVIVEFAHELSDTILATNLKYTNTQNASFERNLVSLVQHFFNHQTHHRGQVSTLLNQFGIDVGITDLLVQIPSEA